MNYNFVGFEVFTAVSMKIAVFWVVAPCSLVEIYQRFRGPCCLHHQGDFLPSFLAHLSFFSSLFRVSSFSVSFIPSFSPCTPFLLSFYFLDFLIYCIKIICLFLFSLSLFSLCYHTSQKAETDQCGVLLCRGHVHSAAVEEGQCCGCETHQTGVKNSASLSIQTKVLGAHWCGNITKQHCNHRDDVPLETTQVTSLIMHQNVV
jgi:hypothetical protein